MVCVWIITVVCSTKHDIVKSKSAYHSQSMRVKRDGRGKRERRKMDGRKTRREKNGGLMSVGDRRVVREVKIR